MKAEIKALIQVAKFVSTAIVGSAIMMLAIAYIPLNYIAFAMIAGGLISMLTLMYDMALTDIKYKEKLNETSKK